MQTSNPTNPNETLYYDILVYHKNFKTIINHFKLPTIKDILLYLRRSKTHIDSISALQVVRILYHFSFLEINPVYHFSYSSFI